LTIRELSLDKALEIAVAMETATNDAIELRNVQGDTPVHKVRGDRRRRNQGRSQPKLVCYRCNGTDHLADQCRFKESTCNQCHRKGHIRAACRSGGQKKKPQHRYQRVHALNHEDNDDLGIYSVYSHGNDSIWIKPCVNGNVIPMELDTGSSVSVISEADYVKYFKGEKLEKSLLVLKTYFLYRTKLDHHA
jgi:hypothetical protein